MSTPRVISLYDFLLQRGSVSRMGAITIMRMDGAGAFATTTLSFSMAMRWGQSRQATQNLHKDRSQFLEKIDILVSKPGSVVPTRGSIKPLLELIRDMEGAGLDPMDWNIPTAVKEAMQEKAKTHGVTKSKPEPETEPVAASAETDAKPPEAPAG